VDCGSFHVWWSYPMNLAYFSFEGEKAHDDPKLQFAPTRWTTVDEIDFSNRRLRWIDSRAATQLMKDVWIPLEELP
jgi:hypothetical protein